MMTIIIINDTPSSCQAIYRERRRMRLTKEQAKQNRHRIVDTASRMFRLHGMANVAVADVMKESGFTHGGFYNHFKSKDELATEAVASAFGSAAEKLSQDIA